MKIRTRCIVAGTRTFTDYNSLVTNLIYIFMSKRLSPEDVEIVSGGAEGADKLGERFASGLDSEGLKLTVMEADWDRRGDSAGFIRNKEMAIYANSLPNGMCVVFWDGKSNGTKNMIKIAEEESLELHVIRY